MSVLTAALAIVVDAALGAWLGVMAFFSFVGAPRAFAVYDDAGGRYVNDVFPRYYRLGVGLGGLAFVASSATGWLVGFDGPALGVVLLSAVATLLAAYSVGVLVPRMEVAGEAGFERYHRQTVVLNGLAMVAVTLALVASHL